MRDIAERELLYAMVPHAFRMGMQRIRNRGQAPWNHYSSVSRAFAERSGALERMRERANIKLCWQRLDSWSRRAVAFTQTHLGGADAH